MKNDSKTCLCEVIPMHLILTAADKSDVGKQREQNEDCAYKRIESSEEGDRGLFIVADGMGGYQAGEVASRIAVEKIRDALKTFFIAVYDQPTVRLSPITEQETMVLHPVLPEDQATIRLDQVKPGSTPGKTQKL